MLKRYIASQNRPENEYDLLRRSALATLAHVGDAAFDSYENQRHRQCLPDTRVHLLQEIVHWATSHSKQYIFWLKGRAGTGKSTIALTIAHLLEERRMSMASFFFKRGGGDLARSRKVITTVAFQLAQQSPLLRDFICDALQGNADLGSSASLSRQYDKLLLGPLLRLQTSTTSTETFIIVLDALDECDDFDDVRLILRLFGNSAQVGLSSLRFFITSRPESPVRLGFQDVNHVTYYELALHNLPRDAVNRDIKVFITYELARIKADRRLLEGWPGAVNIDTITAHADGLFIYAATVCRYINGPRLVNPAVRLEQVCRGIKLKHQSTAALDEMYLMILRSWMNDDLTTEEEQEVNTRLRHVVGSLVLLLDNLSTPELQRLLFPLALADGEIVQETLDSLHAVFEVPSDSERPIQMQHLSFRDFLTDHTRCTDSRFYIDPCAGHHSLFLHCRDLLAKSLKPNICQLASPGTLISDVSTVVLRRYIPPALVYACRYWIDHVELGEVSLRDDGVVNQFLEQYCPLWLEVMCLLSRLPEAIGTMRRLESIVSVSSQPQKCPFILTSYRQHNR